MMELLSSKEKPFASVFQQGTPHIEGNRRLREPQQQAYIALREHFSQNNEPALVQIPVGCGKSGLMALLPFGISQGRVLIVAPNVTIREGFFQAVDSASAACFWRKAGVAQVTTHGPFAAKLDGPKASLDDCRDSHYVVTNVQQLGGVGATVSPRPRRRRQNVAVNFQLLYHGFQDFASRGVCQAIKNAYPTHAM